MSLLTIVQKAIRQTKLITSVPSQVIGNNDADIQQCQELLFQVGEDLKMEYDWQFLVRETTFDTVNAQETYPLTTVVADGDLESFVGDSMFDVTNNREVKIIDYPKYQFLTNTVTSSAGIDKSIAQFDNKLYIYPIPSGVDTISLLYKSSQWITSSGGTGQDDWTADTDTSRFPEYLLQLGLVAYILRAFGVPYAEQFNDFKDRADAEAEKNRIKQRVFPTSLNYVPLVNIQDANFPS